MGKQKIKKGPVARKRRKKKKGVQYRGGIKRNGGHAQ